MEIDNREFTMERIIGACRYRLISMMAVMTILGIICAFMLRFLATVAWVGHERLVIFLPEGVNGIADQPISYAFHFSRLTAEEFIDECIAAEIQGRSPTADLELAHNLDSTVTIDIPVHGRANPLTGETITYKFPGFMVIRSTLPDGKRDYSVVQLPLTCY